MKNCSSVHGATLPRIFLAVAVLSCGLPAAAQQSAPNPPLAATPQPVVENAPSKATIGPAPAMSDDMAAMDHAAMEEPPLQVGDATQDLLGWQRSGVIASTTPRPVPGPIAYRNYERYLKSFEYPIPERFNSTVKSKTGN